MGRKRSLNFHIRYFEITIQINNLCNNIVVQQKTTKINVVEIQIHPGSSKYNLSSCNSSRPRPKGQFPNLAMCSKKEDVSNQSQIKREFASDMYTCPYKNNLIHFDLDFVVVTLKHGYTFTKSHIFLSRIFNSAVDENESDKSQNFFLTP